MKKTITTLCMAVVGLMMVGTSVDAASSGVVSVTFDDGAKTIYQNGLPVLKKYNIPATIYLSTAYVGSDSWYVNWTQVEQMKTAGWEIASHGHAHDDMTTLTASQIGNNLDQSIAALKTKGYTPTSFASPFGAVDGTVIGEVEKRFCSHRRAWDDDPTNEGFNNLSTYDHYQISAVELTQGMTMNKIKKLVTKAENENKWLVFFLHEVAAKNPRDYQISKSKLDNVMAYLQQRKNQGKIQIKTVDQVVGACTL